MGNRLRGGSSSPFYDADFAAQTQRKPRRRRNTMPISTRTIECWLCDRCGIKAEFPDELGHTAIETGWIKIDLTRSLSEPKPYLFGRNEQVLCPVCVHALAKWFKRQEGV
jgi:hypothetical protein